MRRRNCCTARAPSRGTRGGKPGRNKRRKRLGMRSSSPGRKLLSSLPSFVTPAKAGVQSSRRCSAALGSRFRGNDGMKLCELAGAGEVGRRVDLHAEAGGGGPADPGSPPRFGGAPRVEKPPL